MLQKPIYQLALAYLIGITVLVSIRLLHLGKGVYWGFFIVWIWVINQHIDWPPKEFIAKAVRWMMGRN